MPVRSWFSSINPSPVGHSKHGRFTSDLSRVTLDWQGTIKQSSLNSWIVSGEALIFITIKSLTIFVSMQLIYLFGHYFQHSTPQSTAFREVLSSASHKIQNCKYEANQCCTQQHPHAFTRSSVSSCTLPHG